MTLTRRQFIGSALLGAAAAGLARAQAAVQSGTTQGNLFDMDQRAFRPVTLPPKPGAGPSMSADERDALEHGIRCMCGCTLDVYTCRTTDFSCAVSPAMHRDIATLVAGGHGAQEIIAAFVGRYGERVLMEPARHGFNWVGYVAPSVALGTGAVVIAALIRRWSAKAESAKRIAVPRADVADATSDELSRLDAAVRNDR
jgi:cytochrome c-type biogenesis protein CcmH